MPSGCQTLIRSVSVNHIIYSFEVRLGAVNSSSGLLLPPQCIGFDLGHTVAQGIDLRPSFQAKLGAEPERLLLMRQQWRAVLGLLLCAATVAAAGIVAPQLLSHKQRDECQLETQRLYHCSTFNAPGSPLTDNQRELCCDALHTFNQNDCFWWVPSQLTPVFFVPVMAREL